MLAENKFSDDEEIERRDRLMHILKQICLLLPTWYLKTWKIARIAAAPLIVAINTTTMEFW